MGIFRRNTGGSAVADSSSSASDSPKGLGRRSSERVNTPIVRRTSTVSPVGAGMTPEQRVRRRSSTFSQYSFTEAQQDFQEEILDPGPNPERAPRTWKSWLPIMFASIPPVAGLFFKNGAAFFSDLILLCLATIFLHWSITAPWRWYDTAQQVREDQQAALEESLDIQATNASTKQSDSGSESSQEPPPPAEVRQERARQLEAALSRLRVLEVVALGACFLAPAMATYLLYSVRYLLSRPSEGVVSNFNVGIFLLAAEVTPLSHSIKLVLAHTLHLQRVVHSNPYRMVRMTPSRYRALLARLDAVESRVAELAVREACEGCDCGDARVQQARARQLREDVARDVRAAVGPEIDGVVRAVRRYEKKTSTLTSETDLRLADLRHRLDDVIALSAVVARNKAESWGLLGKIGSGCWLVLSLPVVATTGAASLAMSPFKSVVKWLAHEAKDWLEEADSHGGNAHGNGIDGGGGRDGQHQVRNKQVRDRPVKQGRSVSASLSMSPSATTRLWCA
ncbi:hypothetical protein P885DRAFT_26177 [Corynascus similis CBS 632.67]